MRYVRKFTTGLSIALLSALLTYLASQPPAETQHTPFATFAIGMPVEKFPILPRFEVPRNYGFFIGDEIPLQLVIETTGDVMVNLEKLPQKGQKHGPFEVSDMRITRQTPAGHGVIYRVAYALQYFGPTPLTAVFEGVEILYASATDGPYPRASAYKRLVTQPVSIDMARLSPLHLTASRRPKGALQDQRMLTVWLGVVCTAICLTAGGVLGVKAWQQKVRQQPKSQTVPTVPSQLPRQPYDDHQELCWAAAPGYETRQKVDAT